MSREQSEKRTQQEDPLVGDGKLFGLAALLFISLVTLGGVVGAKLWDFKIWVSNLARR